MVRFPVLLALLCLFGTTALGATCNDRRYELFDGRADKSRPGATIIAMHGFLGTARNMRKKTGFNRLARQHQLVILYPNGKRRRWNDGRSETDTTDDTSYLVSCINALAANGIAAPDRIFLAGHSNGGGMAMRMACDHPTRIKAIAVVATKLPSRYPCASGAPVPAIFLHGTADPIAPHQGRPASSRLGATLSSAEGLALWQRRNRCGTATRSVIDNRNDGTRAEVTSFTSCAAALSYVEIFGHGHAWPRPGAKATRLQGPASQEIDATQVIWQFFSGL